MQDTKIQTFLLELNKNPIIVRAAVMAYMPKDKLIKRLHKCLKVKRYRNGDIKQISLKVAFDHIDEVLTKTIRYDKKSI